MTKLEALELEIRGLDFVQPDHRSRAACIRVQTGQELSNLGNYRRAICNFRRGIIGLKGARQGFDKYLAHAWTGIAIAEWYLEGRGPASALRPAKAAHELLARSLDRDIAQQAISSEDVLALCYFELGQHDQARQHYESVLARAEAAGAGDAYDHIKRRMALTCLEVNDCDRAKELLVEVKPEREAAPETRIPWLNASALLGERTWRLEDVTRSYEEILEIFETTPDPPWNRAASLTNGALWFIDQGAERLLKRAQAQIASCPQDNQPLSVRIGRPTDRRRVGETRWRCTHSSQALANDY